MALLLSKVSLHEHFYIIQPYLLQIVAKYLVFDKMLFCHSIGLRCKDKEFPYMFQRKSDFSSQPSYPSFFRSRVFPQVTPARSQPPHPPYPKEDLEPFPKPFSNRWKRA